MLDSFRSNMKGVALAITILIAVVFILSGTGTMFLTNSIDGAVAEVGEVEISEFDVLRSISNQKQQILEQNPEIDSSLLDDDFLRPSALERLIRREVLVQTAAKKGLRMSDSSINGEILAIDGFQTDGKFDQDRYKFALQNQGYTHASFKQMLNNDLIVQQLISGISDTAFVTEFEDRALSRVSEQKRDYYYLTIPSDQTRSSITISEDDIETFYGNNLSNFVTEPMVKIDYIELSPELLADKDAVTDDMIRQRFEMERDSLEFAESRRVSHILITESNPALIKEIQEKLELSIPFEDLVTEYSEDFGSASIGGDLGFTSGDTFPENFEDAVKVLEIDQISDPILTEAGTHFIKLTDIQRNDLVFEDERDRILQELSGELISDVFIEKLEILKELSFNAQSLNEVAEDMELEMKTTDFFARSGGNGIASNGQVIDIAFSDDVLNNGYASEVIELETDSYVVLKLNEFADAQQKVIADVKDDISAQLTDSRLEELMIERSNRLLELVKAGETIEAVAKQEDLDWQVVLSAGRRVTDQNPEINSEVFRMQNPDSTPEIDFFVTQSGDYVLVSLTSVVAGDYESIDDSIKSGIASANLSINQNLELLSFEEASRSKLAIAQ